MAGAAVESVSETARGRRFRFRLARKADDAALRRLLRETPMDGPLRVTLRREPSYFGAAGVEGPSRQTLVVADEASGRIVGMGARSIRERFVDGAATPVGYLSGLRIHPDYRGGTLLARGFREVRRLHEDGATGFYLTTIAEGNQAAVAALAGRRARLPTYFPLGRYYTFLVPLRRDRFRPKRTKDGKGDVQIRPLREEELPLLIDFLHGNGASRSFFPRYTDEDFFRPQATFQGMMPADILTARRGERLVACLGLWDQRGFKQTIVEGYRGALRCARPAYNALARLMRWPRFPTPGEPVRAVVAALPLAAAGEEGAFAKLLQAARRVASRRHPSCDSLLIGALERDPLFNFCRQASLFRYITHVYLVYWDEQTARPGRFRQRDLYLELGCL